MCVSVAATRIDVLDIWHHRGFICDKRLFLTPNGCMIDADQINMIMGRPEHTKLIDRKFDLARLMQDLELTYEETVLLGALALMSPGACSNTTCTCTLYMYM